MKFYASGLHNLTGHCRQFGYCCIEWHFITTVVTLHLCHSPAEMYLCVQVCTVSVFADWPATYIIRPTSILLVEYEHTYLSFSIQNPILPWGTLLLEWLLFSHVATSPFILWSQWEVDVSASSIANQCQHYHTFGDSSTSGSLSFMPLQPSFTGSGKSIFSSSFLSGSALLYGKVGYMSTQTYHCHSSLLNGNSLAIHSSQHVETYYSLVPYHMKSDQGCLSRLSA